MSRTRTPAEKKRSSYTHDHRTYMEAPHAFRKNWSRKKTRINRTRRRVADRAVQAVARGADPEDLVVPRRTRGEFLRKVGVVPLGEFVAQREKRRRTDFLPGYIGLRYDAELAPAFSRFLASLTRGRSPLAIERAAHLRWLLETRLPNNSGSLYVQRWIRRFFEERPYWRGRVLQWFSELKVDVSEERRRTKR